MTLCYNSECSPIFPASAFEDGALSVVRTARAVTSAEERVLFPLCGRIGPSLNAEVVDQRVNDPWR
jgi:hypothetical protein